MITNKTIKTTVDHLSGEVVETEVESQFKFKDQEPDFIKMYLEDITRLLRLPAGSSKVILCLCREMNWKGEIAITPILKNRVMEECNFKNTQQVNNAFGDLKKKDIIQSIARGVYMVNPHLIAKGKWKEVKSLRVTYNDNKRTVSVNDEEQGITLDDKDQVVSNDNNNFPFTEDKKAG